MEVGGWEETDHEGPFAPQGHSVCRGPQGPSPLRGSGWWEADATLMRDLTGPSPHISVGGRAGKTPRRPFLVGGGLPKAGQGWSVSGSRLLDRVFFAGSKAKGGKAEGRATEFPS